MVPELERGIKHPKANIYGQHNTTREPESTADISDAICYFLYSHSLAPRRCSLTSVSADRHFSLAGLTQFFRRGNKVVLKTKNLAPTLNSDTYPNHNTKF